MKTLVKERPHKASAQRKMMSPWLPLAMPAREQKARPITPGATTRPTFCEAADNRRFRRASRIDPGLKLFCVPVLYPLVGIAVQIEEAVGIGLQCFHFVCLPIRISSMPSVVFQIALVISKRIKSVSSRSRGSLALRIGW